ncbi:MAG: hypothetical protein NWF01_02625 [Candidatus Bathyarchaeota archaeon]|nr:hypothetical protein [Candidatus Bathyarchaeota archaeon]
MQKFRWSMKHEFWNNFPLFLCGVYLIYMAGFDDGLFVLIAGDLTNRVLVTIATMTAAGVPVFFAIGTIKNSILIGRETIYFYEKMLMHWSFWLFAGVFCFLLGGLKIAQAGAEMSSVSIMVMVMSFLAGAYLVYYSLLFAAKINSIKQWFFNLFQRGY